jgi:hypothetical protein
MTLDRDMPGMDGLEVYRLSLPPRLFSGTGLALQPSLTAGRPGAGTLRMYQLNISKDRSQRCPAMDMLRSKGRCDRPWAGLGAGGGIGRGGEFGEAYRIEIGTG